MSRVATSESQDFGKREAIIVILATDFERYHPFESVDYIYCCEKNMSAIFELIEPYISNSNSLPSPYSQNTGRPSDAAAMLPKAPRLVRKQ
jgi:hypothetical protein